jgi:hypothetical protein
LRSADLRPVAAAALLHLAVLVASALCWRRAFRACDGAVGRAECRYARPRRRSGRVGLFARSLGRERNVQRSAVALMGIGSVRGAALALLVAGAAVGGLAPRWLAAAPVALAAAAFLTHRRVNAVRIRLRAVDCAALFGWAAVATACRCASIGAALVAVGVHSPAAAAVVGLVGLELSALIPLAPGLAGVGGAAVAVAIAAHGVPSGTAFAGGVAFYVAEAAAGVAFGVTATAAFIAVRAAERDLPVPV